MSTSTDTNNFYVIKRERGTERNDLPLWASHESDPFHLDGQDNTSDNEEESCAARERVEVPGVPGAFQILNVLSKKEAKRMVDQFEELGFHNDAAVSLSRSIRHNQNLNWIADNQTLDILWDRCQDAFVDTDTNGHFLEKKPLGLNGKFRVYKYDHDEYFQLHSDGSWPGSRVVNGKYKQNAFHDRWSMYTMLLFLTEDFEGGETEFWVNKLDPSRPARHQEEAETTGIRTPVGGALCFPHGKHPLHCLHASAPITKGVKYIIRSDVLFEL